MRASAIYKAPSKRSLVTKQSCTYYLRTSVFTGRHLKAVPTAQHRAPRTTENRKPFLCNKKTNKGKHGNPAMVAQLAKSSISSAKNKASLMASCGRALRFGFASCGRCNSTRNLSLCAVNVSTQVPNTTGGPKM